MGGVVIAEHGQLHHRLVVDECELQLTQLDTHFANGAEAEDEQDERDQGVGHDERFALQVLGLAIEEEGGGHVRELELHERSELDAAGCLVSIGRSPPVQATEGTLPPQRQRAQPSAQRIFRPRQKELLRHAKS